MLGSSVQNARLTSNKVALSRLTYNAGNPPKRARNQRPTSYNYSNQEVIDLLEISSATLKKWRDQKLIGYSAVGNTYYYTDEDIESFFRNNHKKSVFETGMDD